MEKSARILSVGAAADDLEAPGGSRLLELIAKTLVASVAMERSAALVALVLLGAAAVAADPESYAGFRVLAVALEDPNGHNITSKLLPRLRELGVEDSWGLDREKMKVALMVAPDKVAAVVAALEDARLPYQELWSDVQQILDIEARKRAGMPQIRSELPDGHVTFNRFMRYEEIERYLHRLARDHADLVTLQPLGRSWEGRAMTGVLVSLGGNKKRPSILVDAGIHAREWIAPAFTLYLLQQLVEVRENRHLLEDLDWYVLPMLNPDGYEYSHTTNRMWRKNRSNESDPWCRGVDLNRNFDFHWNLRGDGAAQACNIDYPGRYAFSELETKNLRDFILNKNKDKSIKLYLTMHSWGWFILFPWSYTKEHPSNYDELLSISKEANKAMVAAGSKHFRVGSPPDILYAAPGSSMDWVMGVAGVDKAWSLELPGGAGSGFEIEEANIAATVRPVFEGVKAFARHAR
ncbi:zinc carboxypeptidase-like [Frankliniella occidentalis]|uniref:Zinc carboxypeptidase-like n=1 Tax=Frankliniella occidentalis TaxID=133901 RepID=A0A9C6TUN9_FRAOC|nr:zinc carboxypeptidase-like [Frankliniella occidentalis]